MDAGLVSNTAVATAADPAGAPVAPSSSSTDTPISQSRALSLTKTAAVTDVDGNGITGLADQVGWTFRVRNTGSVSVAAITVADPLAGPVTCLAATLAPGASTTCSAAAHPISQADVDAGVIANTATAQGIAGVGPTASNVTSSSSSDTPVARAQGLELTKTATATDVDGDGANTLGDTVTWSFRLSNTGTVTLNALTVTDPSAGAVSCPATTLAPSATKCSTIERPIPLLAPVTTAILPSNFFCISCPHMAGPGELHGWQLSDQCSQLQLISINAGGAPQVNLPCLLPTFSHRKL